MTLKMYFHHEAHEAHEEHEERIDCEICGR